MTEENTNKPRPRRAPAGPLPQEPGVYPLPGMRKVIAKRLTASMQNSPHFYVTSEVNMEPAAAFRETKKDAGIKISYNDLILKATGLALKAHPHVNAVYKETEVEILATANVAFAVAKEDGLVVPVLRDVDQKPLEEVATEAREMATKAREGKLQMADIQGGSITVSNMGMFDVDSFTAIINPPQSAILAISSIKKVPVVDGEEIRPGLRMKITMSSDHRMVDGALAARFLMTLKELLENPENL